MLGLGRVGIQLSPPFILWDNSFSCSIQWNLGALLAQPQKNYLFLFPWGGFPWQTCKVLVPWKRTPWHWSKHVKFRPSWLFQKRCLSLHSWWDAMSARNGTCWVWDVLAFSLLHLSFFGTIASVVLSSGILGRCLHNHRKTTFSYFRGKAFLGKPARCLCHGNEHRGTDPNTSNSGHHDSSRNAVFLCTADEMQYWHVMVHVGFGTCWHSAFSTFHSLGQ